MKSALWSAIVALAAAGQQAAPPPPIPTLQSIRESHKVPGLVAGCVGKGGVERLECVGVRKAGAEPPMQPTDRMHLGSCTKAFTATLAAALVADGKLKWESTVGEVLGASEPGMDANWKGVTLEQLLRHRGGAPASVPPEEWKTAWHCAGTPQECRDAFVRAILSRPPPVEPGRYQYSNQGYSIAGRMCESVGGAPYEQLLAARVLDPLGIREYGFGPPSGAVAESPVGHDQSGTPNDSDNPAAIAPAGRLHMPVGEWMKFVAFHAGAKAPTALEGTAKQLEFLHRQSETIQHEALGWMCTDRPWGGRVLTHSGSNNLWYCTVWISPERGFGVVAACNMGGSEAAKACDEACGAMIRRRIEEGAPPAAPVRPTAPAAPATRPPP